MAPSQPSKKTRGRRKISMKLIEDENARRITLSKRRGGLFKKATELTTLCGAQIAVIVFSLGGKAYSFGHPSVESVADRFFANGNNARDHGNLMHHGMRMQDLKEQCDIINDQLKVQKKRGQELEEALESSSATKLGVEHLSQMNLDELKEKKEQMERLKEMLKEMVMTRPDLKVPERTCSQNLDLGKVEGDGRVDDRESSPIPHDWLKL